MQLQRFTDIEAFYRHAEPFLLANEAAHCLTLGLCTTFIAQPETRPTDLYLALVSDSDAVVAVAMRTPQQHLILSLIGDDERQTEVIRLIAADAFRYFGAALSGVHGPALIAHAFADAWGHVTGSGYHVAVKERIYQLDSVVAPRGVPGMLRRAIEEDRLVLERWIAAFFEEAMPSVTPTPSAEEWVAHLFSQHASRRVYLWVVDGELVTMVGHTGPTPHGMRIGPVYTPPNRRRHGYASAATAAVSQTLLDDGRDYCFLFTDLANPTSNAIYQQIGYRSVCDVDVYAFDIKE